MGTQFGIGKVLQVSVMFCVALILLETAHLFTDNITSEDTDGVILDLKVISEIEQRRYKRVRRQVELGVPDNSYETETTADLPGNIPQTNDDSQVTGLFVTTEIIKPRQEFESSTEDYEDACLCIAVAAQSLGTNVVEIGERFTIMKCMDIYEVKDQCKAYCDAVSTATFTNPTSVSCRVLLNNTHQRSVATFTYRTKEDNCEDYVIGQELVIQAVAKKWMFVMGAYMIFVFVVLIGCVLLSNFLTCSSKKTSKTVDRVQ